MIQGARAIDFKELRSVHLAICKLFIFYLGTQGIAFQIKHVM